MSDAPARHPQYAEAKSAAVRLLAGRARTRADLETRLRSKGLASEAIEQALGDLQRAGYIDDEQYARDRIEDLLRSSRRGAAALVHALTGDGLPEDLAERIVAERLEGEDPGEWALETAMERAGSLRGLDEETARRRLYGYLKRRGFADAEALRAVDEALSAPDDDQRS
jgi:regulatory protein